MEIEELIEAWKEDSKIDRNISELTKELARVGELHSKYNALLLNFRLLERKANDKYYRMKRIKWEYYSGKLDQEQLKKYGWEPFPLRLKSDISIYLESDSDLLNIKSTAYLQEQKGDFCEKVLTEIKSRTFQLRDILAVEKFLAGD